MIELNISLNEIDFRHLVAGHVVKHPIAIDHQTYFGQPFMVNIALKDIGFETMESALPSYNIPGWGKPARGFAFRCVYCRCEGPSAYGEDDDHAIFRARNEVLQKGWKDVESSAMDKHAMKCNECIEAGF